MTFSKLMLAMFLCGVSVAVAAENDGLVCTIENPDGQTQKVRVQVRPIDGKKDRMRLEAINMRSLRPVARLQVSAKEIEPLMQGKLAEMDKKTLKNLEKIGSVSFKISGQDVFGNPKLKIDVTGDPSVRLDDCGLATPGKVSNS